MQRDQFPTAIIRIASWFKKAKPTPTANDISTQLGVHFEEVSEMLEVVSAHTITAARLRDDAMYALNQLADHMKATEMEFSVSGLNRVEFLDAICDQIVTGTGCGTLMAMDVIGGLDDVARSNDSKFDPETGEPIFNEHGKIMKGPAYTPPSLGSFV